MGRVLYELNVPLRRELVHQGLDVLTGYWPRAGHLRYGLGPEAIEVSEDSAPSARHPPLAVDLLGGHPHAVKQPAGLVNDRLQGRDHALR